MDSIPSYSERIAYEAERTEIDSPWVACEGYGDGVSHLDDDTRDPFFVGAEVPTPAGAG